MLPWCGSEEFAAPVDYPRLRMMLKCDSLALTYLIKNAANVNQRYSNEERLLILYFRWQFLSLPDHDSPEASQVEPGHPQEGEDSQN